MSNQGIQIAADAITAACTAIICSGDEGLARQLVPELDRIRAALLRRTSRQTIRLDDTTQARRS